MNTLKHGLKDYYACSSQPSQSINKKQTGIDVIQYYLQFEFQVLH